MTMNRPLDSEYLLEAILLLAEEDFGDAEVLKEQVKLLIRNHWDLLNKDTEIAAARKILEDLAEDLEQDEDAPRIHPQEQLELFDGPNEWAGGDRAGFELSSIPPRGALFRGGLGSELMGSGRCFG